MTELAYRFVNARRVGDELLADIETKEEAFIATPDFPEKPWECVCMRVHPLRLAPSDTEYAIYFDGAGDVAIVCWLNPKEEHPAFA